MGLPEPTKSVIHRTFTDIADNINNVQFKVYVKESYVPVIHYCFLRPGAPPPVRQINEQNMDDICTSWLSPRYIIDAMVNGHYIQFDKMEDMETMRTWLKIYLDEHEGVDTSRDPERTAVLKDIQKAYNMMTANQKKYNDWQEEKHPTQASIFDLLANI